MQFWPIGSAVFAAIVMAHNDTGDGFRLAIYAMDGRMAYVDDPVICTDGTADKPYCCPVPAYDTPRIIVASEIN